MRFTGNRLSLKLGLALLTLLCSQNFVACQTKEQKKVSALQKCQALLDKDEMSSVGDCYSEAILANPESGMEISKTGKTAVFKKCLEFKDKNDYKKAIPCFDSVTALEPENANVYFLLADSYYQYYKLSNDGQYDLLDGAEENLKKGLDINPDDAPAHGLYGQILEAEDDFNKSAEQYKQAVRLDRKTPVFWIKLALMQEKTDNISEAATSYRQVLLIDPKNTLALYNLGLVCEKLNKIDEAISAYEKLLQIRTEYDDTAERLEKLRKLRFGKKSDKAEVPQGVGVSKPQQKF